MYYHPCNASASEASVSPMSKTIRELIDDARASGDWDAVADWCESFDWSQAEEVPVDEYLLERAVRQRAIRQRDSGESQLSEAVAAVLTVTAPTADPTPEL